MPGSIRSLALDLSLSIFIPYRDKELYEKGAKVDCDKCHKEITDMPCIGNRYNIIPIRDKTLSLWAKGLW
uniref:Uncharacterized protein n=1 Tax=viral metagenome TaxID=1070528 RepID=A0A6C0CKZ5_9ZZZZ